MKINRKNGLRKMQVTDVIIPLLKGGWYHRVSPVKEKPHVLRGDVYFMSKTVFVVPVSPKTYRKVKLSNICKNTNKNMKKTLTYTKK